MDFKTAKLQVTRLIAMQNGVSPGLQNWTDFGIWGCSGLGGTKSQFLASLMSKPLLG